LPLGKCIVAERVNAALLLLLYVLAGVLVAAPDMELVLVEWLDSCRGEGWVRLGDLNGTVTKCRSVGWVVAKNESSMTLAGHLGEDPEQCCGDLTIPKCSIRSITPLRAVKKKVMMKTNKHQFSLQVLCLLFLIVGQSLIAHSQAIDMLPPLPQGTDDEQKQAASKLWPIVFQVEKSNVTDLSGANPSMDAQAAAWGMAPELKTGSFEGTLNGEKHWKFSCWGENTRREVNPCADIPIGIGHRATWVHNRELLQVFAYAADGKIVSLRYIDVTIDPKNPPPPDDPVQNLPAFQPVPTVPTKQSYPLLVHVYGAMELSFPVGQLPEQVKCNASSTGWTATATCTDYPPVTIYRGTVSVDAAFDGKTHRNLSCDAKWRWSKCSVIGPGFYLARWSDKDESKIMLLAVKDKKPVEIGFKVK
jgi:hypothetical protein